MGALASSVAEAIWKKRRGAVDGAVRDAVGDAVGGAVDGAVDGAVGGAVGDAVGGAVDDAVDGAVRDAVRDAVDGAVDGAVRDAVGGAVGDAVRDAVGVAVGGAVDDAVDGAVRDAVRDAVAGAVDGAVRDAVGGAVDDAVRDAVGVAVDGAVRGAVRDAVGGAVGGAVQTAIVIAKNAGVTMSWHYWLGGQFWVGGWGWGVAFVNFFFDICKLKLAKDIMERAEAYRKVCESVNYIWPNSEFVMVCARPIRISRDEAGRLHSDSNKAIEYPDGYGLYMLHGVKFEKELWEQVASGKMSFSDILKIENTEQRLQAMRHNPNALMQEKPKLLAKSERGNELYLIEGSEVNKFYNAPKVYLLGFVDPSKESPNNVLYEEVSPEVAESNLNDPDSVNAFHCKLTLAEYQTLQYES